MITYLKNQFLAWHFPEHLSLLLAYGALILGAVVVAWVLDWVTKRILLRTLGQVIKKSKSKWDDVALKTKVFHRLAHLAPAMVIYLSAPFFVEAKTTWSTDLSEFIRRMAMAAFILVAVLTLDAFFNAILLVYRSTERGKAKPVRSYVQVAKIFTFSVAGILLLSTLLNKSPWAFLTGLSAMAAVLLLVFKDSILGFVASIQIAAYDTLRVGDWIEMPKFGADGDVLEISLNTIKVQNFDKTIVSVPTSAVLTDAVRNWRGMSESGGRRIKRHINIDVNTIKFCDEEMLKRFSEFAYVKEYLATKQNEIADYNQSLVKQQAVDTKVLINGRHLTNVGTFRAYVEAYLEHHEQIHDNMTFLVRQLQPTVEGLPIEIYVFTKDIRWAYYEAIQADIFDHILAVAPLFDLAVFQNTSGQNYKIDIVSMPQASA